MFKSLFRYLFTDRPVQATPPPLPSDEIPDVRGVEEWKELSRAELVNRCNGVNSLKGSNLMSDYDIFTKFLNYSPEAAEKMVARMKMQKLEELKLQVLAQNPQVFGVEAPNGKQ